MTHTTRRSPFGSISQTRPAPALKPLAYACLTAMGLGHATGFAQDPQLEEVTVTGSRIQQTSGMNTPTPVTVVGREDIDLMAPGNVIEALSQLPLFYNNRTPNDPGSFFSSPGSGNLNLRGIGTKRTLVLLDGRRVVSSTRFGGTDISAFPEALLRSVETVTGGASAAYGTDAVTGVVNFILDTDLEGLRGHAQSGRSGQGDGDNWEASFAGGFALGERTHLLFSVDTYTQDAINSYEGRDWYQNWGIIINPDPNGPRELIRPNVVSRTATFDGLIFAPGTPLHNHNFNSAGTAVTPFGLVPGQPGLSQSIAGGAGEGDDHGADTPNLATDYDRENQFLRLSYDASDNVTLFAQALRGESFRTQRNIAGQFHGPFSPAVIYSGNPFLPPEIQAALDDPSYSRRCGINGFPSGAPSAVPCFNLNRMGHSSDLKRGGAALALDVEFESTTLGLEAELSGGGFFDGWSVDAFAQRGETTTLARQSGGIRLDRIHLAHDAVIDPATGQIVCNVTLVTNGAMFPDCVPLNLFGRGNASDAAIDWVTGFEPGETVTTPIYYAQQGFDLDVTDTYVTEEARITRSWIEQDVIEFSMTGEIFDDREVGPIGLAFGGGWREESMNQIARTPVGPYTAPDGTQLSRGIVDGNHDSGRPVPMNYAPAGIRGMPRGDLNNSVVIQYSKIPNVTGARDVAEVFGEVFVPVLADNKLNIPFAARWADYSGSGGVWVWKAGVDSQLTDALRLRATRSRDVRTGTLSERFDQTGGASSVQDPARNNERFQIFRTTGGNPNIRPEEADTTTVGLVIQPTQAPGLSLSLDWFQVDLVDAIAELSPQQIVDQCNIGDVSLCGLITRQPDLPDGTPGAINVVSANFLNVANATVEGADLEISYRTEIDWFGGGEQLGIRLLATHLAENSFQGFDSPRIDRAGQIYGGFDLPTEKITAQFNYRRGPFRAFIQARWIDGGVRDALETEGVHIDNNTIESVTYVDMNLRYDLAVGEGTLELYGNVQNLLDEDPPISANFGYFGANASQTNSFYDLIGRRYTLGARFSF